MEHAYTRTDGDGNELYSFDFPNVGQNDKGTFDPDKVEQLAIMQALYKVVREAVNTNNPFNLRAQVDDELLDAYDRSGAKSFDMRVNGQKVGTASVKTTKAKTENKLHINDFDAYEQWLLADGSEYLDMLIQQYGDALLKIIMTDGVIPAGCSVHEVATPETVTGTSIRVDPLKVYEAAGPMLGSVVRHALTEGVD